ncbi:hypothetical protein NIES4074_65690 (plasmid) [Cylindrospermum sp. NIES-4074]|nr:hypothetical protein NIES4074_65690 [Cylindrospermum sp. NIES-4074]
MLTEKHIYQELYVLTDCEKFPLLKMNMVSNKIFSIFSSSRKLETSVTLVAIQS